MVPEPYPVIHDPPVRVLLAIIIAATGVLTITTTIHGVLVVHVTRTFFFLEANSPTDYYVLSNHVQKIISMQISIIYLLMANPTLKRSKPLRGSSDARFYDKRRMNRFINMPKLGPNA